MNRLSKEFYLQNCLEVAPQLVGKIIFHRRQDGVILSARITETEAYYGTEDTACHAHKGKTPRSEILWREGGAAYVYLCYGIHWLLNAVTGSENDPQAVLIRACENYSGPGKLTKYLEINGKLNGKSLIDSHEIWIADDGLRPEIITAERVGIAYAAKEDVERKWRFIMK